MGYIIFSIAGVNTSAMGPVEKEEAILYLKKNGYAVDKKGILTKWQGRFPSFEAKWVNQLTGTWHPALIRPFQMGVKI